MLNEIMDVLTSRFEMTPEKMQAFLNQLDEAGRVRLGQSRCNGACLTCSTCTVSSSGDVLEMVLEVDPTAIVILKRSERRKTSLARQGALING
ncbi:hypothetical protein [Pontiella sulfatireligans]|uniref:Transcriptional regulator HTH-type FeoC domain-containing protein n=1 Tax=Pontiella sulfatireligans TaxID=2750658 RepID=A0A6C2UTX0_9BACT|nr:hypothetical protein [Pontiella sulfatireligans]VGO22346.1 hypothetical protein SCARR_04429 [Pontiella sulfatireligans]